ncbi:MAG: hypothetical protein AB7F96_05205 [Beijerinckiaceae bacterium]
MPDTVFHKYEVFFCDIWPALTRRGTVICGSTEFRFGDLDGKPKLYSVDAWGGIVTDASKLYETMRLGWPSSIGSTDQYVNFHR